MEKIKIAIVGATGLVGRKVIDVIEQYNISSYPVDYFLFASKRSVDQEFTINNKSYFVKELTDNTFSEHYDYAIFCAGGEVSTKFAPIAASSGCIVIDNSSAFRMQTDVPLVVPEVNSEEIFKNKGIIANPNCSTIQAVIPLNVLDKHYHIKRIVYSTYQAVSGAGNKGIVDLTNGLNGLPPQKFPHEIVNNCIPHIDSFLENGYTKEEEKMINETRKILNRPDLKITATAVRVPVINSHSESINVEFEKDFDLDELKSLLSNSKGIVVQDDINNNVYPLASEVTGHDESYIGRIRRDYSVDSGINFWCVGDNVRKGAATNAVQILKILLDSNDVLQNQ